MDDFFEAFFNLLDEWFGEIGVWFVSLWTLLIIFIGFGVWWEFIK